MQKILNEDISKLNLDKNLREKMKDNNINTVLDLCNCSRMELSNLNFTNVQINDAAICLQLAGLDLKKNHAKKNTSIDA